MAVKVRTEEVPLDGGWGWVVVAAAFMAHAVSHGVVYSFGVLFIALQEAFHGSKADIAWISSTCTGALYLIGPLSGKLCDRFGFRFVTVLGSSLASAGYILSVFVTNLYVLYVTMGLLAGCGIGMVFLPSIVVVTKYFHKRRAVACGIALSGCGVGGFIFSPLLRLLVQEYGWRGTMLILGGLLLNCIPCGLIYRPLHRRTVVETRSPSAGSIQEEVTILIKPESAMNTDQSQFSYIVNTSKCNDDEDDEVNKDGAIDYMIGEGEERMIKSDIDTHCAIQHTEHITDTCHDVLYSRVDSGNNKLAPEVVFEMQVTDTDSKEDTGGRHVTNIFTICSNLLFPVFLLSQFLFFLGFYFPFVYVPDRGLSIGLDERSGVWAVSTIGLSSIFGRVVLGHVADHPRVNRSLMFKVMLLLTGVSTALGPLYNSSPLVFIYAVVYGVATGSTLSLTSVVLVDLMGISHLNDAFGFTTFISGIGSLIGPPIAGALVDATTSYDVSFVVFGCLMAMSGVVMLLPETYRFVAKVT